MPSAVLAKPRLLDQVSAAIRMRHYSRRTEEAYVFWIRKFILFHGKRHPDQMREAEISGFVSWLVVIGRLTGTARLVASLLYGAGLRLQECLELRVKDIDFERAEVTVRRGKGQKDRRVMLPQAIQADLATHLKQVGRQHAADLAAGNGRVALPDAMDRKFPSAATEWRWQFVFPAGRVCRDPKWGPPSRYHIHESAIQRSVTEAGRAAGLTKRVGCHNFRHSFATLQASPCVRSQCGWLARGASRAKICRLKELARRRAGSPDDLASETD